MHSQQYTKAESQGSETPSNRGTTAWHACLMELWISFARRSVHKTIKHECNMHVIAIGRWTSIANMNFSFFGRSGAVRVAGTLRLFVPAKSVAPACGGVYD